VKRQRLRAGDLFVIDVGDQHLSSGQVLELVPEALNSVGVVLWKPQPRSDHVRPCAGERPFAVLLTTPDLLTNGSWPIHGTAAPLVPCEQRPYEVFRSCGWVGAKVTGSGVVHELLEASIGLKPWDDWADPRYLDGLLYPGQPRPMEAVFKHAS
jgi:hypothetical protein